MDPHFSCSNYAFKSRTCSKKSQNKPSSLSFKKTVNDVDNQWHLVLRYVNLVISENGRRCKAIPRMRGTLIKSLVHAMRALSRASKNNWFQIAQAKKSPHGKNHVGLGYNIICCMSSKRILRQGHTWHCWPLYHPWLVSPLQISLGLQKH